MDKIGKGTIERVDKWEEDIFLFLRKEDGGLDAIRTDVPGLLGKLINAQISPQEAKGKRVFYQTDSDGQLLNLCSVASQEALMVSYLYRMQNNAMPLDTTTIVIKL